MAVSTERPDRSRRPVRSAGRILAHPPRTSQPTLSRCSSGKVPAERPYVLSAERPGVLSGERERVARVFVPLFFRKRILSPSPRPLSQVLLYVALHDEPVVFWERVFVPLFFRNECPLDEVAGVTLSTPAHLVNQPLRRFHLR